MLTTCPVPPTRAALHSMLTIRCGVGCGGVGGCSGRRRAAGWCIGGRATHRLREGERQPRIEAVVGVALVLDVARAGAVLHPNRYGVAVQGHFAVNDLKLVLAL